MERAIGHRNGNRNNRRVKFKLTGFWTGISLTWRECLAMEVECITLPDVEDVNTGQTYALGLLILFSCLQDDRNQPLIVLNLCVRDLVCDWSSVHTINQLG